jgi:hydroxymethylpyrimidine pyrophosphatase-like HAD family hydrolase
VVKLSLGKVFSGGEISEMGITKSAGIKVILDYFNIDKEDIYAIGDDYNDFDMLKFANHSIAMGHAPEEIKELCEYITEDIDHDGLYYAMKNYDLI